MLENLNHISEFLCLLISFFLSIKHKNSFYFMFTIYLLFITAIELTAHYYFYSQNYFLYNISVLIFTTFNSKMILDYSLNNKYKKIIKYLAFLYVVYWLFVNVILLKINVTLKPSLIVGLNLLIIFGLLYLYDYLYNTLTGSTKFEKAGIWFSSGIVLFCSGTSLCFSFLEYSAGMKILFLNMPVHNTFPKILSLVLYSCTSISLYLWQPKRANS